MVDLSRILITGSEGVIGSQLDFGVKKSHRELDVTNSKNIKKVCDEINPSGILCLSSKDIRSCEKNPSQAHEVNVNGVINLAKEAAKRNIPIILLSTGAIFNGPVNKSFNEEDTPQPQNIYGQTKYLAEKSLPIITPNYLIIRTGWIFGTNNSKKIDFIKRMINSLEKGEEVKVVTDQTGSPTYLPDFIDKMKELIQNGFKGIFHVVNRGIATPEDILNEIISIKGINSKSKIIKNKLSQQEGILRSHSEALTSKKVSLRSWKEALKEYFNLKP
ncbi:SDR family oxidoreductase [Nanoarchaeota archaeon]